MSIALITIYFNNLIWSGILLLFINSLVVCFFIKRVDLECPYLTVSDSDGYAIREEDWDETDGTWKGEGVRLTPYKSRLWWLSLIIVVQSLLLLCVLVFIVAHSSDLYKDLMGIGSLGNGLGTEGGGLPTTSEGVVCCSGGYRPWCGLLQALQSSDNENYGAQLTNSECLEKLGLQKKQIEFAIGQVFWLAISCLLNATMIFIGYGLRKYKAFRSFKSFGLLMVSLVNLSVGILLLVTLGVWAPHFEKISGFSAFALPSLLISTYFSILDGKFLVKRARRELGLADIGRYFFKIKICYTRLRSTLTLWSLLFIIIPGLLLISCRFDVTVCNYFAFETVEVYCCPFHATTIEEVPLVWGYTEDGSLPPAAHVCTLTNNILLSAQNFYIKNLRNYYTTLCWVLSLANLLSSRDIYRTVTSIKNRWFW